MLFSLEEKVVHHILSFLVYSWELSSVALSCQSLLETVLNYQYYALHQLHLRHRLLKPFPSAQTSCISTIYSRVYDNAIMLIGGIKFQRQCDLFCSVKRRFSRCCSMGMKRGSSSSAIFHNGLVFAVSGDNVLSREVVEYYDIIRNTWTPIAGLPNNLAQISLASACGKLYVIGGHDRVNGKRSNNIFELQEDLLFTEPFASSDLLWKKLNVALNHPRSDHSSICFRNQVWIVGGIITTGTFSPIAKCTTAVEIFDPIRNTVTDGSALPGWCTSLALLVIENSLYAYGIRPRPIGVATSIERFDTEHKQWETIFIADNFDKRMTTACIDHSTNEICIFGGKYPPVWESFNLRTRSWTTYQNSPDTTTVSAAITTSADFNNRYRIFERDCSQDTLTVSFSW